MYVVTVLPPLAQNNPLSFNIVYNEHTPEHVIIVKLGAWHLLATRLARVRKVFSE